MIYKYDYKFIHINILLIKFFKTPNTGGAKVHNCDNN